MTANTPAKSGQRFQNSKEPLDFASLRILRALADNPRLSMSALGRRVGQTTSSIQQSSPVAARIVPLPVDPGRGS